MKRKITSSPSTRNFEHVEDLSLNSLADAINREHHEVEQDLNKSLWGKYPAMSNTPLLDELDKLDGGDDDKAC